MSDAAGAQAISAVSRGVVRELPHARTFVVPSSRGDDLYLVTLATVPGSTGPPASACTCEAGRHGRSCWHVRAAHLMARRTPRGGPDAEPRVGDLEPDRL